jgi:hypothetical protein
MPNVVKGIAETMSSMTITEVFRAVLGLTQPRYNEIIDVPLGNTQFYHFDVGRGRQSQGLEIFSIEFNNGLSENRIWFIEITKNDVDTYYTAHWSLIPK